LLKKAKSFSLAFNPNPNAKILTSKLSPKQNKFSFTHPPQGHRRSLLFAYLNLHIQLPMAMADCVTAGVNSLHLSVI